ncbi:MAG: DUF4252 domain-containing protein [Bacteroidales bacterium]|nr:DUF4252 domain-containing protein [Bacteroidales bacterium]
MRKTVLAFLIILAAVTAGAPSYASTPSIDYGKRVTSLMKEYSLHSDFQCVNLGRMGLAIVKQVIRNSGDKDALELLDLMRNVKQVTIASFADCDPDVRTRFESRLSNVLTKDFLLVEAKDADEKVQIFAIPDDDGENISDLIISAPRSGAVICVRGKVNVQDVATFLEAKSK